MEKVIYKKDGSKMNIEKAGQIEELIENLKIEKQHKEEIVKRYKSEINMIDFIISELEYVLTKD